MFCILTLTNFKSMLKEQRERAKQAANDVVNVLVKYGLSLKESEFTLDLVKYMISLQSGDTKISLEEIRAAVQRDDEKLMKVLKEP